jgi:serine phosphatase RsbU (regulator of sigma subunit)
MGRVRSAMAAIAQDEPSPGRVLTKVNRMLCRLSQASLDELGSRYPNTDLLATALHGRLDRRSGTFVYAVAGHPGPIVVDPVAGSARLSDPTPNLPLGIDASTRYLEQVLRLPARGSLLAFTDGLFERRDESIDTSLATLVARATRFADHTVDQLADALLEGATTHSGWSDDVALVVLGW